MTRNIRYLSLYVILILFPAVFHNALALPAGFVYLQDVNPTIIQDMRYFTNNNFIGRPIQGYQAPRCILTRETALALSAIQQKLLKKSLSLKVYDCYRPQMAVDDFVVWSTDKNNQKMKKEYYPEIDKPDLFKLGYIAAKSGHTRGSTVDLSVVHLSAAGKKPVELDMGTHFDYLGELSNPLAENISDKAHHNRLFLRNTMLQAGFKPLATEWWHFTLKNEPFPSTYFNFPVK